MPLMPKRTKYRKPHRLYHDGKAKGNTELQFGDYGLQAKEGAWITTQQIEAARVAISRFTKRGGKEALRLAMHKLPVKCKFVKREESGDVNEN